MFAIKEIDSHAYSPSAAAQIPVCVAAIWAPLYQPHGTWGEKGSDADRLMMLMLLAVEACCKQ